jgi:hypothetical protein
MKSEEYNFDSLFREKFEAYEPELSAEAVERMNHIISRKRNNRILGRMAVAAGISLVLASVFILLRYNVTDPTDNLAAEQKQFPVQVPEMKENTENITHVQPSDNIIPEARENKISEPKKTGQSNVEENLTLLAVRSEGGADSASVAEEILVNGIQIIEPLSNKSFAVENNFKERVNPAMKEVFQARQNMKPDPVVIEYIVSNNKDSNDPERGRGIAGIFKAAKEIGNDVTLGNLRDYKDQLFALEFIKSRNTDNSK